MEERDKVIKNLQEQVESLKSEVKYLRNLLDDAKTPYAMSASDEARKMED